MQNIPKISIVISDKAKQKIRKVYEKYLDMPLVVNGHTFKYGPDQTIVRED